ISTSARTPDSVSSRTCWGSCWPLEAFRVALPRRTWTLVISSPVKNRMASNSWTTESLISISLVKPSGVLGLRCWWCSINSSPSSWLRMIEPSVAYSASKRRMKPTWIRWWPSATSASTIFQEDAASGLSGFSQRIGISLARALSRMSSCRKPGVAIRTALTSPLFSASSASARATAPGMPSMAAWARARSTSTTAATSAPWMRLLRRWMWSAPMRPAPITATRRVSVIVLSLRFGMPGRRSVDRSAGAAGQQVVFGALGDRHRNVKGHRVHVLLHDAEDRPVQGLDGFDDRAQVRQAVRWFRHDAGQVGSRPGHVFLVDLLEDVRVDLLQVQVADPVRVVLDELQAGCAAVFRVAGVQAQVEVLRVGGAQQCFDVLLGSDVRVGVGVELLLEAEVLEQRLAKPVVAGEQVTPGPV